MIIDTLLYLGSQPKHEYMQHLFSILTQYQAACDAIPGLIETYGLEKKNLYQGIGVSKSYFFHRLKDGNWKPEELIRLDREIGKRTTITSSAKEFIQLRGKFCQLINASGKKQTWIRERVRMSGATFASRKKNANWSFREVQKIAELLVNVPDYEGAITPNHK